MRSIYDVTMRMHQLCYMSRRTVFVHQMTMLDGQEFQQGFPQLVKRPRFDLRNGSPAQPENCPDFVERPDRELVTIRTTASGACGLWRGDPPGAGALPE